VLSRIPVLGPIAVRLARKIRGDAPSQFQNSTSYWQNRYVAGGNSGAGSYDEFAQFKASVLNRFVEEQGIQSVIEFGCGDGNQLLLANYPTYTGFDVSETALQRCRTLFSTDASKRFRNVSLWSGERADLVLSLDVIYHLVEDDIYESYMTTLFAAAKHFVVIYSSNHDTSPLTSAPHVRHRRFTTWIDDHCRGWRLIHHIPNQHQFEPGTGQGSFADFYFFQTSVPC
jgi:hypothetical protein